MDRFLNDSPNFKAETIVSSRNALLDDVNQLACSGTVPMVLVDSMADLWPDGENTAQVHRSPVIGLRKR